MVFIISLFSSVYTLAANEAFTITNAVISDKTGTTGDIVDVEGDNVNNNVVFHSVNDSIKFEITIKNSSGKDLIITSITDNNTNEYIEYSYDKHENYEIEKNNTFKLDLTSTYKNELMDITKRDQTTELKLTINYKDKDGNGGGSSVIINPDTKDNIYLYLVLLTVSALGLILTFVFSKKKKKALMIFLMALLTIPTLVKAASLVFTFTVNFEYGLYDKLVVSVDTGNGIEEKIVPYNEELPTIPDPTKEGYEFAGWVDDEGNPVDSSKLYTEDSNISAKFNVISYSISYTLNDGEAVNQTTYTVEDEVTLTNPTKTGYTFTGWTGTGLIEPTKNVTISTGSTGSLTYTANVDCNNYVVTFDPNSGTVTETSRTVIKDEAIGQLPEVTRSGFQFFGWYTELVGGTQITEEDVPTSNLSLHAHWGKTVGTCTLETNNLTVNVGSTKQINIIDKNDLIENYTFTSDDTSIATVDQNGVVTGVSDGTTRVVITGNTSNEEKYVNIYVNGDTNIELFNITPNAQQNYFDNAVSWNTSKENFLQHMQTNFESYGCKMNSDSSIQYASGSVLCDKSLGYDTGTNSALNVYLHNSTTNTNTSVSYTKSSNGIIYNMIPGETYYWEVASDTTNNGYVKAIGKRRTLDTNGIRNTRDLGGLPVDVDGDGIVDGTTKFEKLFRGERTYSIQADVDLLTNLGITKEVALYSSGEQGNNIKLANYRLDTMIHYQVINYKTQDRTAIKNAMQDIVDGESIYFHCVYGSDRTGTMAYILEGLLGVLDEDRFEDYELSVFFGEVDRNRYFETDIKSTLPKFVYMLSIIPDNQSIYDWFMSGSTDVTADQQLVNDFRAAMINYS